jgi:hypothetical protein
LKSLTTAIYAKASGSNFMTALGSRLYKGRAPEGASYPYAVFFFVSNIPQLTFSEDYEDVIMQFSLFSITSGTTEIENLYTYLKALYDECSLTITGATLIWMKRDNAVFLVEDHTTPSGTAQVWAYHVDYSIMENLD